MTLLLFTYIYRHTELQLFIHSFVTFVEARSRFPHRCDRVAQERDPNCFCEAPEFESKSNPDVFLIVWLY